MISILPSIILIYICDINGQITKEFFSLEQPTDIQVKALKKEVRHPGDHRNPHVKQQENGSPTNVLTIYKLFDNRQRSDDQAIFESGTSTFAEPTKSLKHELKTMKSTIASGSTSMTGPYQSSTIQSPKTPNNTTSGLDLMEINPYYQIHNSPFFEDTPYKEKSNVPSLQSKSLTKINGRNRIFQTTSTGLNQKFGLNANMERQSFLNELEKLRSKTDMEQPNNNFKFNHVDNDNSLTQLLSGVLPTQEFINPSLSGRAREDKLLMDMLTQGLHPLQEIVVDEPRRRTSSKGIMEEGRSEVPGLHSLQAYTISDTKDTILHSDLAIPIDGSNTVQTDSSSLVQSLNRLRQRFTFGNQEGNKESFDIIGNRSRSVSAEIKSISTEGLTSPQTPRPKSMSRLNLSAAASFTEEQLSGMSPQTSDSFGLINGMKNHPNIWDFFMVSKPRLSPAIELVTTAQKIQERDKNISIPSPQIPQPRTRRKTGGLSTISTSLPTNIKPIRRNINFPQNIQMLLSRTQNIQIPSSRPHHIPIPSPRTQRQLRDNTVVDVINLPALEVTLRFLPVGSVSRDYVRDFNSQFTRPTVFKNNGIAQTRVIVPWVSDIVPSVSVNTITERNVRETYVNKQGKVVDKVTETTTRNNFNITQHFNPLMTRQLISPDRLLQQHSAYTFPLVISRSSSVPTSKSSSKILEFIKARQDVNSHLSQGQSMTRQSQNRPEMTKRQRSRSSRFFTPIIMNI